MRSAKCALMSLTANELTDLATDQRKEGRLEEALASATAATKANPESANAWWQVALARIGLEDHRNAIPALERTVELSPHFDPAWAALGDALVKTDDEARAASAFERALQEEHTSVNAMQGLADIYSKRHGAAHKANKDDIQKEIKILTQLERQSKLSYFQMNRLGNLYYANDDYWMAEPYWKLDANRSNSIASRFNLGLLYNQSKVSREADAIDAWRRASAKSTDDDDPEKSIKSALPGVLQRAAIARSFGPTLLQEKQWHRYYISPFRLLGPEADEDTYDLDSKRIQKLKKAVLREIEFEDGKIEWVKGLVIDKSRAISLIDELGDGNSDKFWQHLNVYEDRRLLDFMMTGAHEHFLVSEDESPIQSIEYVEDGTLEWISEPFAKQFDLVLSEAISQKNLIVIECLMDGRRWVSPVHDDLCFANARQLVGGLLAPLRTAVDLADNAKPSAEAVAAKMAEHKIDAILNLLAAHFWDIQDEASYLVRMLAKKAYERHGDVGEAKKILRLAQQLKFKSASESQIIEDNFSQIDEISQEECKYEVHLTRGNDVWKITKEGAVCGSVTILTKDAKYVRWGTIATRKQNGSTEYDYEITVTAIDGRSAKFSWSATSDIEKNLKHFESLMSAVMAYLFPKILERIQSFLAAGGSVEIGPCQVTSTGVQFTTSHWFSSELRSIPWERVMIEVKNGDLIVADRNVPKAKITIPFKNTNNAPVLQFLALSKQKPRD